MEKMPFKSLEKEETINKYVLNYILLELFFVLGVRYASNFVSPKHV